MGAQRSIVELPHYPMHVFLHTDGLTGNISLSRRMIGLLVGLRKPLGNTAKIISMVQVKCARERPEWITTLPLRHASMT